MRDDLRLPRTRVLLRGTELDGVISAEIESSAFFVADKFRLEFASSVVQSSLLHVPGGEIEIHFGLAGEWISQLTGLIDEVSYDPTAKTIKVEGRDLSSRLIEAQTDESFANRTASEIALIIGLRHGLLVAADTTSTPVGRYYQSEHDRISLGQFARTLNEWDLLSLLAIREGFDLYVSGRTLRFGLPAFLPARTIRPADCISMRLGHSLGVARPIDVLVRSWNSKTGKVAFGRALSVGIGPVWERKISRPNLTSTNAQQEAQRVLDDLKRHEWTAAIVMPGELSLNAHCLVSLDSTSSAWDRLYRVVHVSKRIDAQRGFTQSLSLQGAD